MSYQTCFLCVVLLFVTFKAIAMYSDDLHHRLHQDSAANDYQSTEHHKEGKVHVRSQPVNSTGCPKRCSCKMNDTDHIISVDCSSIRLPNRMVPDLPETTVELSLINTSILKISCQSFKLLCNLENLNLAFNEIQSLPPCVFVSQPSSLLNLTISFNYMKRLDVKLFQNLSHLKSLDLSRNFITSLESRTFPDLVQLVSLNLSFNHIKRIASDAFKGLHSLKTLSLQNNRLNRKNSFHKGVFQDLGALEMLDVRSNLGSVDKAVSALKNVSHLYLEADVLYQNFNVLGTGFRQLTSLRVLNLNWFSYSHPSKFYRQTSTCELRTASSNFFGNIRTENDLELHLSYCSLKMKVNDTFLFPSTLVTLDLSFNKRINFGSKRRKWMKGLINTRINYLDLSGTWNSLSYHDIDDKSFKYLVKTRLKTLVLKMNRIEAIFATHHFPTTIEKLDISDNRILISDLYFIFANSHQSDFKLKELHANNQHKDPYLRRAVQRSQETSQAYSFGHLHASNTRFKRTAGAGRWFLRSKANLNCPQNLEEQAQDIKIICLPPDLEAIYVNSAVYSYDFNSVPHIRILNNTVMRHVEAADNSLTTLLGPVENVPSLQFLNLTRNQCKNLGVDFFKYMVSLQTLILRENFIGPSLAADVNGLTFSTLMHLKLLDLSHNYIKDLSRSAFINNINLETLDLSNNQLSEFQPTISNVRSMYFLNLSVNLLSGLSEQTSKELKVLKSRNKHFKINVLDNRLLFTCDYLAFLHLVLLRPHIFYRVERLKFKSTNGTKLSYNELAHHFPLLARECLAQRFFDVILISFFVVVGIVGFCAVIYYKRWKLRYLYYIGHRRMHIGELVVDYAPAADVFLTYDQDDLRWRRFVQRIFLPGLNQRNISYILGETDFPGGDLMAHVTGAVVGTRKTVVLLSADIFDDHHREFEMNLSIMREIDTRSLKIVPVFVEKVDLARYPREIELFLRNQWQRCLSYNDNDFWDSFVDAVREDH